MQRYGHALPGDLLHLDIKKLGRIERPSHRVTGDRRGSVQGAGWEYVHVAIDDHSRIASCLYSNLYRRRNNFSISISRSSRLQQLAMRDVFGGKVTERWRHL